MTIESTFFCDKINIKLNGQVWYLLKYFVYWFESAFSGYVGDKMSKIILDLAELELNDTEVSILSAAILMSPSKETNWNQNLSLFQLDLVWYKRR